MQASSEQRWALLGIWVIPAFWAVNYLIARIAPGIVQPHTLAMGRFLIIGLVLGWTCRQELWQHRAHIFSQWRQYLALDVMGMLFCGAWVYVAAMTSPAMNIALIYTSSPVMITLGASKVGLALYLSPLWGTLVSWEILGKPLGWHHLMGALLILPGVALSQSTHR